MLQKILAIIGCVFLCLILSVSLGIGAKILVETINDRRAESVETQQQGDESARSGDFNQHGAEPAQSGEVSP